MLKLALNLMIAGNAQLIAEALVLGEAHGLDRAKMLEVMGASAVGSPFVKYKSAALVQDDYTATFTGYAMWKDLTMALAAAHDGTRAAARHCNDPAAPRGLHRLGLGRATT